jgi:hypothetical protein
MKRALVLALAAGAALALVSPLPAAPKSASLQINHVRRGCHNWSLNGAPMRVHQTVVLARGGSLLVTNDDLMVQDLVEQSGPTVQMRLVRRSHMKMAMNGKASPFAMSHMGAQLRVTFPAAGTYRFELIDRGDYVDGIDTVGRDNEPTLTVTVA